jgi:hypothetical protein
MREFDSVAYYKKELKQLDLNDVSVKFFSPSGDTKTLNVNADFLKAFNQWVKENKIGVNKKNDDNLIDSLDVRAKRRHDGNSTYHTVQAVINDYYSVTINMPTYGYERHYEETIARKLEQMDIIKRENNESLWTMCERLGIEHTSEHEDVKRKKDMVFEELVEISSLGQFLEFENASNEISKKVNESARHTDLK